MPSSDWVAPRVGTRLTFELSRPPVLAAIQLASPVSPSRADPQQSCSRSVQTRRGVSPAGVSDVLFSIGEVSRRTGVSADVIRAWERRYDLLHPQRSASNFRLYSPADVSRLRLMRHYTEQNMPRWRAAELVRQASAKAFDKNPGIPKGDIRKALSSLHAALERFDATPADLHLQRLSEVFTPGVILRDVVLPYLRELGDRWECGEATIAQEHFASCFLESWMMSRARGWGRGGGRRVVLACVPGEHHALGLVAFGVALRELGWSITYLGRDTPVSAARRAADAVDADAVVLAAVLPETLVATASDVAALREQHAVFVGGPATSSSVVSELKPWLLPRELLTAAKVLTLQRAGDDADVRDGQAAPVAAGARAGGSGTASMSTGAA